jgi:hypothetical protein
MTAHEHREFQRAKSIIERNLRVMATGAKKADEKLFPMKTVPEQAKESLDALTRDEQTDLLRFYMEEEKAGPHRLPETRQAAQGLDRAGPARSARHHAAGLVSVEETCKILRVGGL